MAQIQNGYVNVEKGNNIITGINTSWVSDGVESGDEITIAGDGVLYNISSVDSETQLKISVPYSGETKSNIAYTIAVDFTTPDSFPIMNQGDIETATIFTRAIRKIQSRFNSPSEISALNAANIYTSVSNGLSDTADGDYFFVIGGENYTLYSNNSGTEKEEFSFTSQIEFENALSTIFDLKNETEGFRDEVEQDYTTFFENYLGSNNTDPTEDKFGNPIQEGAFYFNTDLNEVKFYFNGSWGSYGILVTNATKASLGDAKEGVNNDRYMTPYTTYHSQKWQQELRERVKRDATLYLDFANNEYRIYEGLADGNTEKPYNQIVTHTRASDATGSNALGTLSTVTADTQRLVYSPETGRSEGLLVEEERTNLINYSEDLTRPFWRKINIDVNSNVAPSPDGNVSCDKFIADTIDNTHSISVPITVSSGTYVYSAYYKKAGINYIKHGTWGYSGNFGLGAQLVTVDLNTGEVTSTYNSPEYKIQNVGNGFVYVSIVLESDGTEGNLNTTLLQELSSGGLSNDKFVGDGTSGVYMWGAQLEKGSTPSSYIKTEGTAVTRAADVVTQGEVGKWYSKKALTLFAHVAPTYQPEAEQGVGGNIVYAANLSDGTLNNWIGIGSSYSTSSIKRSAVRVAVAGNTVIFDGGDVWQKDIYRKIAATITEDTISLFADGVLIVSDSNTVGFPSITKWNFGRRPDGGGVSFGLKSKSSFVLPYALTESEASIITQPD